MMLIPAERIYMIRRKDRLDPRFFLLDVIDVPYGVLQQRSPTAIWTPTLHEAREFYTEEAVETFLYEKLRRRPCEIIMVK